MTIVSFSLLVSYCYRYFIRIITIFGRNGLYLLDLLYYIYSVWHIYSTLHSLKLVSLLQGYLHYSLFYMFCIYSITARLLLYLWLLLFIFRLYLT